ALLAVQVVQQRDARRAVRVILDGEDLGRHAWLVALEVNDAITPLDAAAPMARGDAALIVAPSLRDLLLDQRALGLAARDLLEGRDRHAATSRGRRPVHANRHCWRSPRPKPASSR